MTIYQNKDHILKLDFYINISYKNNKRILTWKLKYYVNQFLI
ncbi:hypothetical protein U732_1181 [Clostridium argentinense CDC 2741]|uniref:Uncharacterized protein n=1 Tax=Clostridium argentinense CDC 2741 TaxID=1418104 RepID=A0A0C1R0D4_9CLOT|nr:hypothetical protein U732_1181 [Clostridium argentinense CDC 2741]